MRASKSTFSPWFNASATPPPETEHEKKASSECCRVHHRKKDSNMCLTINVIDGESVREVGHIGLLSEWGLLLGLRWSRVSIIQALDRQE